VPRVCVGNVRVYQQVGTNARTSQSATVVPSDLSRFAVASATSNQDGRAWNRGDWHLRAGAMAHKRAQVDRRKGRRKRRRIAVSARLPNQS